MDVKKTLVFLFLSFLLINCSPEESKNDSGFQKTSIPICDQQIKAGEFLVHWNDGRTEVIHSESENKFKSDFLKKHRHQIKLSEPHYRINISQGYKVKQRDWGGSLNWGLEKVSAQKAWDLEYKGQDVIVAIIDSGLDLDHEELEGILSINPKEEPNGLDDDENGLIDDMTGYDFASKSNQVKDFTGHGTHIAGIIAANHSVGQIKGMAPAVKILPLTFIEADGAGSVSAAIDAIRYSAQRGAKVINASWGGEGCSIILKDEIKALSKHNILFVSAAGNSGNNLDNFPEYPAAFTIDNQIAVGASTFDDKTAGFSNYGKLVSLVAPGAFIISTYPEDFYLDDDQQDGLVALNGTSMAAPFVSAAAAILWSKNPKASYQEVKNALIDGVNQGPYPVISQGQLNIERSLELLPEPEIDETEDIEQP